MSDIRKARSQLGCSSRQQWHVLTLSVLSLLLLLILASCGTTLSRNGAAGQGSRSSAGHVATQTPAGVAPQPTPRLGQPVIAFCLNPPTPVKGAPGTIQVQSFVCGRDFHPAELVTLTASGRLGRLEWQQRADQMGAFVSPLPPLLCRNAPLTLIASGNQGSRSNSLTLDAEACPPAV